MPRRQPGRERRRGAALACGLLAACAASSARAGVVLITNLSDGAFVQVSPMSSQSVVMRNCVNSSTGRYRVTATGSGAGGEFTLSAGAGLTLPYALEWSDSGSATSGQALAPGVALTGQITPLLTSCLLGSITSTVVVRLASNDLQAAVAGVSYAGIVTLLVAPD